MNFSNNFNIAIVVHESITPSGPGHNLRDFCLTNYTGTVLFIAHPLLYINECYSQSSRKELYLDSVSIKSSTAPHIRLPESFLYIKDVLYSLYWVISSNKKFDLYIGLDPLNALAGILLKLFGFTKKNIYYSIDYFPERFSNKIMNFIYHLLDKICVFLCDETWNVSSAMKKAREKNGMKSDAFRRQYHVPIGIWFNKAKKVPKHLIDINKLVFIGHLVDFMGVDLPIRSLTKLRKKFPNIHLEIIGGGEAELYLKKLVDKLKIKEIVTFHGWIKTEVEREHLLRDGAIGLATFNTLILDEKVQNADPIKIKEYTQYGMPVIVTDAISTNKDITKKRAGVVINYTIESFINAVSILLSSSKRYNEYRENARSYAKEYDWNIIFKKNLNRILS